MAVPPTIAAWLVGGAVLAVAVWARHRGLAASHALIDSIGPYWASLRGGLPRPHADAYGWGLLLPYWFATPMSDRLWDAVRTMAGVHALAAPVAVWAMLGWGRKALPAAIVGGIAIALDPGLLDTALSGAKGYLAPLWIGVMVGACARRDARWSQAAIPVAWAFAIMNHPLAICAWPFLFWMDPRRIAARVGIGVAAVALLPQAISLMEAGGGVGLALADPLRSAVLGYAGQGSWGALFVALGPLVALGHEDTRPLAKATLAALLTLLLLGFGLEYLRDHHLRMLTIPAVAGWSALRGWRGALGLVLLRIPTHPVQPEGMVHRDDTLGLAHHVTDQVMAQVEPPLIVDRAWFEGSPSVEPAAILLDLHLRGLDSADLALGGQIVVIAAAERDSVQAVGAPGVALVQGDRFTVGSATVDEVRTWSSEVCDRDPRFGGAWDGLHVLHPDLTVDAVGTWWDCP